MPINPNRSRLDQQQILQHVFDGNDDRLRVDASVTATIGDIIIEASESDIAIADQISGNLLKINPDGSIDVNAVLSASSGDSVLVSDGTDNLEVNPDGSINVVLSGTPGTTVNTYNEVNSVGSGILTTIVTYTATNDASLKIIEVSGTNVSRYDVVLNGSNIARKYTNFGCNLNESFDFKEGLLLTIGDVLEVKTIHQRPNTGDFNGRIQVLEL